MSIPSQLTAGDSLRLSIPSRGHTVVDGWSLTLVLAPLSGGARVTASTSAADPDNPGNHLLEVATTVTAAWRAGAYTWALQFARSSERVTDGAGRLSVLPDIAAGTAAPADTRSIARQALDAIEAYLSSPANLAAASYTIAGRSLNHWPRAELIAERSKWQAEVAREEAAARMAAGLADRRRIYVRFGA